MLLTYAFIARSHLQFDFILGEKYPREVYIKMPKVPAKYLSISNNITDNVIYV